MNRRIWVCTLLLSFGTTGMLTAQGDSSCTIKTVGELLDQTSTDPSAIFWGATGVVVGLAAAEKLNTKIIVSVSMPAAKLASDYLVAQNLRSQLSKFSPDKRVKVCRSRGANSLLPTWVAAALGLKDVTLITEPTVNIPQLKYVSPPSPGLSQVRAGFDQQFLAELGQQGNALKLRQSAMTPLPQSTGSSLSNWKDSPLWLPQNPSRLSDLMQTRPPATASLTTTIRGRVYDSSTELPIGNATVQLVPVSAPANWVGTATSAAGDFTFTILNGTRYQLSAFSPGYYSGDLFVDGSAPKAAVYRIEMRRRSPYPCTFTIENRTPWVVGWRIDSSAWRPVNAFSTIRISVRRPGDLHSFANFNDGPPIVWKTVPVDCDGPGSTILVPLQN